VERLRFAMMPFGMGVWAGMTFPPGLVAVVFLGNSTYLQLAFSEPMRKYFWLGVATGLACSFALVVVGNTVRAGRPR